MTTTTTALATTAQASTPAPPRRERKRTVGTKLRKAIALLESGECKTQKAAAAQAGITEHHLSRSLKMVHVEAFIAQQRARNIQLGSLRASRRIVELIDAESEHVAAKVVERILVTTGDIKGENSGPSTVSVSVGVSVQAGYVIDLSEPSAAQQISSQGRSEAKPLITLDAVPNEQSERGGG